MSEKRTLESFDKKDLVELIRRRLFYHDRCIPELTLIEFNRKGDALNAQMDALEAEMQSFRASEDWPRYDALSKKWDRASKAYDKLCGIGQV